MSARRNYKSTVLEGVIQVGTSKGATVESVLRFAADALNDDVAGVKRGVMRVLNAGVRDGSLSVSKAGLYKSVDGKSKKAKSATKKKKGSNSSSSKRSSSASARTSAKKAATPAGATFYDSTEGLFAGKTFKRTKLDDLPALEITKQEQLRDWLAENHSTSPGVWLVTYKKAAGKDTYVAWNSVVDELLCVGWIDGRRRGVDELRTSIVVMPRRSGSGWAATNKKRVYELEEEGRMLPVAWEAIEAAKEDGSWNALDAISAGIPPPELAAALRQDKAANDAWSTQTVAKKKYLMYRLNSLKSKAKRAEAAEEILELLKK